MLGVWGCKVRVLGWCAGVLGVAAFGEEAGEAGQLLVFPHVTALGPAPQRLHALNCELRGVNIRPVAVIAVAGATAAGAVGALNGRGWGVSSRLG